MEITLHDRWTDNLTGAARSQIPFALAQALNAVAFAARRRVVGELPQRFAIRSGRFLPGSIRVDKASKGNPRAVIGVDERAWFMLSHEEGGSREPHNGRKVISVPTGRLAGKRITPANRPSAILARPGAFVLQTARGPVIAERRGRRNLQILWGWETQTRYQQRFGFVDTVVDEASKRFDEALYNAILRALPK